MKVQDELAGTENRINVARLDYNEAVTGLQYDAQFVSGGFDGWYDRI